MVQYGIYFIIYLLPVFFLFYMAIDVIIRNPYKIEHRLISLLLLIFMLMLMGEFFRQLVPIHFSEVMIKYGLSGLAVLTSALLIHLCLKITGIQRIHPLISYLLLIPYSALLLLSSTSMSFYEKGIWKMPVYDFSYYVGITIINAILVYLIFILNKRKKETKSKQVKKKLEMLIYGKLSMLILFLVFGYIDFGGSLPPYPYLSGTFVWGIFVRLGMIKYNFLSSYSKKYEILFNLNSASILLVSASGKVVEANLAAVQQFGKKVENNISLFVMFDQKMRKSAYKKYRKYYLSHEKFTNLETTMINAEGKKIPVIIDGDFVEIDYNRYYFIIVRNITEQKQTEERIKYLAFHDVLTELPNRLYFQVMFDKRMKEANVKNQMLALAIIDLDSFKQVNDTFGHQIGDELLKHVAYLINRSLRPGDFSARFGGDEFVIIFNNIQNVQDVEEKINKVVAQFKQPLQFEDTIIKVSSSIGISIYPDDGIELNELLKRADDAMYEIKAKGKNDWKLYKSFKREGQVDEISPM